jgi:hypothetical protein
VIARPAYVLSCCGSLNFLSKTSTMVALVNISSTIVMRKDVQNQPSALNIVTLLRGYITRIWSLG